LEFGNGSPPVKFRGKSPIGRLGHWGTKLKLLRVRKHESLFSVMRQILRVRRIFTARCTIVQSAVLRTHFVCLSLCPSVCLSVTLVDQDHIGWKSWILIARTISPAHSLFVNQRPSTYSQGNMGKFCGDYLWSGKKWRAGAHCKRGNISETRKDKGKVTMEGL